MIRRGGKGDMYDRRCDHAERAVESEGFRESSAPAAPIRVPLSGCAGRSGTGTGSPEQSSLSAEASAKAEGKRCLYPEQKGQHRGDTKTNGAPEA